MTYRGPYRGIGASVDWVFGTWLPASGREPHHAPLFEVHHVSPPGTPPEEVLSDIYLPLAPA
jgi:AraC family transcriptional regulator